jgi:SAM-dependent methyltransferase
LAEARAVTAPDLFSNTEVASLCLLDRQRTEAFREAIAAIVRPDDVVVDAGAGSGILSFFAARAGASRVFALERIDDLCEILRGNVRRNGLEGVIEVVHGDARDVELPGNVDVVVAELIDTWLLDELQLPVLAALRQKGVIGTGTRIVPELYEGWITLGAVDFDSYGVDLRFPHHDWPDLDEEGGWLELPFQPLTEPTPAFRVGFRIPVELPALRSVPVQPIRSGFANAVRLTGRVDLGAGVRLGETPSFNGAKLVPIPEVRTCREQTLHLQVSTSSSRPRLGACRITAVRV